MTVAAVEWAQWYAARGWPVLPLRAGQKVPASAHGCRDATVDAARVARWWTRHPDHGVAVATGHAADVIDIDSVEAADRLQAVAGHDWPTGPVVLTPRGFHVYVAPTGRGNTAGIVPGVDYRGMGGYVVAPPTELACAYLWAPSNPPTLALPECPAWLLDAWDHRRANPTPATGGRSPVGPSTPYGRRALEGELGRLAVAPVGTRNDELVRAAYRLGRLVAGGELDAGHVAAELLVVACRIGLTEPEAVATIRSGLTSGLDRPRSATR